MTSIFFATPAHKCDERDVAWIANDAQRLANTLKIEGCQLSIVSNNPWLDAARAHLVANFLKSDCSHLFFRDDDISIEPWVLRGLLQMQTAIAVAPYRQRTEGHPWAVTMVDGKIVLAGLGCCLIARCVIEGMIDHFPELTYEQDGNILHALFLHFLIDQPSGKRWLFKEDHAFFLRAEKCGFGIEALDGAVVNHGGVVSTWTGKLDEYLPRRSGRSSRRLD